MRSLQHWQLCATISGPAVVQRCCPGDDFPGCVTLEQGLGSAFHSHSFPGQQQAEIKGSAGEGRALLPADPSADCRAELRAVVGGPEEASVTSQQEGK